jgi:hypothetical protein
MRLSRMLLIAVLAVLASLVPAASPAFAESQTATVLPTVCQERVCLTVTVESSTDLYLMARVDHPITSCGHFEATLSVAGRFIQAASTISCIVPPFWCTGVNKPAGSGWVKVKFVSEPATPGEPVVFFF